MISRIKEFLLKIKFEIAFLFSKPAYTPKIFCIGYNKTGTTTIGKSLEILGYRNSSFNQKVWREYYKKGDIDSLINYTSKFESFDDLPWLLADIFPIMDERFPNSKFIYLEREAEAWKRSFYNWAYKHNGEYPDMEKSFNSYQDHKSFVLDYFKDRKDDLLILNVTDPEAFFKLGEFIGRKAPSKQLPHFNKA